jgi:hypothetical protein
MPYRTVWEDPEVYLEHNGVTVYHTYKDDEVEQGPRTYYFVTNISDSEDEAFDVREFKVPSRVALEGHPPYLSESYSRYRDASPEQREQWGREWHLWQTGGEAEVIKTILREAIDQGLIPKK